MLALPQLKLPTVLLILWQILYLAVLFRRHVRFGLGMAIYSAVWYGLLIWLGVPWVMAIMILTTIEVASVAIIALCAPEPRRTIALAFAAAGVLIIIGGLIVPVSHHWRVIAALTIAVIASAAGVAFMVSGFGNFGMTPFGARRSGVPSLGRPDALNKYTYWSARAIESVTSDNRIGTRFHLKLAELGIPIIGSKLSFERTEKESGRHAAAQELEHRLQGYIDTDAERILRAGAGFMQGVGDVYVTAYGTQSAENAPTGGRAALFTSWTAENGQRIAVCLFGSMDNFDGWIRDSHPGTVSGWASSATSDVMKWLQKNVKWNIRHWGESVGNVACKMASYDIAIGTTQAHRQKRRYYEKDLVLKQENAEWFSFIYYTEGPGEKRTVPFDIVLIGRPFWLRSKHLAVRTTDEYSGPEVTGSEQARWEKSYASFWKKTLRLQDSTRGWPLYLYRLLLALQRINPDL